MDAKNGATIEKTWYLIGKADDRCLLKVGHSDEVKRLRSVWNLHTRCLKKRKDAWKHLYEIEICTSAKELTMSLDKYAHLIKCKIWRRNGNKRKYVLRIQFSFSKHEHQNEVVWLIHWKRAVKYQCSDFPRHATLDVPKTLICPDTPQKTCQEHDTLWHVTFADTSRSDPGFAECRGISRSRKFHEIAHFTQC